MNRIKAAIILVLGIALASAAVIASVDDSAKFAEREKAAAAHVLAN